MHREYVKWWSPSLGREMELLVFGKSGTPVLVFPSSMGRFHEWEDFGMIEAFSYQLNQDFNQFICVDSVDAESFYNKQVDPYVRIMRHRQYDSYIIDEVVPFIHSSNQNKYLIAAGASFGAYHALNLAFKYPAIIHKLVSLSGKFEIRSFMDTFNDNNVYYNNPVEYVPNIQDENQLRLLKNMDIRLVSGEHDMCKDAALDMHNKLNSKGISSTLDIWLDGAGHDWPWWREMIKKHIP